MPFYVRQQSIGLCSEEWLEHRLGALRRNIHLIETVFDSVQAERVPVSVGRRGGTVRSDEEACPERSRRGAV
jgi:hypothetical protein